MERGPTLALTGLMRRTRRLSVAALCALPLALGGAAVAQADDFATVFGAYQKAGIIDGCKFTPQQLKNAKAQIPNDFAQYAPDFKDAIDAAAKQRASGSCGKKTTTDKPAAAALATSGTTTPGGTPPPAATS
ncbi:MAG: hypothetical protein JWM31_1077, partial [Solirubrobacterales bacterium]|nr:hypothetical protein [Solirubrobacterales bacterium]